MISITRRIVAALAALAVIWLAGPVSADQINLLSVQTGHSVVLQTPGLTRVAVGDGKIAGIVPVGTSQVVVNGKSAGHTSVNIWANGRRITYEVTVTAQELDDVAQMLRSAISAPNVEVLSFDQSIVVRGTVGDGAQFQQISDILTRFTPLVKTQGGELVNAVTISQNLGDLQHAISNIPGATDIRVDPDGKGNVIVSGNATDAVTAQAILDRARGLAGPYLASNGQLIDRLNSLTNSQIDIKVYVLEVDKTASVEPRLAAYAAVPTQGQLTPSLQPPAFPFIEAPRARGPRLHPRPVLSHEHAGADAEPPYAGGALARALEPGPRDGPRRQGDVSRRRADSGRHLDDVGFNQRPVPKLRRAAERYSDRARKRLGGGGGRAHDLGDR